MKTETHVERVVQRSRRSRRGHLVVGLVLLAPTMLGLRRANGSGGCGGGPSRVLIGHNGVYSAGGQLDARRTEDISLATSSLTGGAVPSLTIQYGGDEDSAVYLFDRLGSGETLLGANYFGYTHIDGRQSGDPRATFLAADIGLSPGAWVARNYDRGECSLIVPWIDPIPLSPTIPSFRDQLKSTLDVTLINAIAGMGGTATVFGNSTLTPLLRLNLAGEVYGAPGNTNDTFRFSRRFSVSTPFSFANYLLTFEGGFQANAGVVSFSLSSVTVRQDPGGGLTDLVAALEAAFRAQIPGALAGAINGALLRRFTAAVGACVPGQAGDAQCYSAVNGILETQGVPIDPAQATCRLTSASSTSGRCFVRPFVSRVQEYPEGFELVLSENFGDANWRFLALDSQTFQATCLSPRYPHAASADYSARGRVDPFFAP